ncbi:phage tail protein I [Lentisphaerota bacterium ZTH]|nr:phage tail protein I [Lentisphaerota bacterium]WET05828.1 phage tail protein I [Lentisphaerota bacterium ZTH]
MTLLPPNASDFERAVEAVTARLEKIPVPLGSLWNPESCPTALLPWLGWALSIDVWDDAWTETQQREIVARQYEIHAHKGTIGALREALDALGCRLKVTEWFEQKPEGAPYTFKVEVEAGNYGLSKAQQNMITETVEATKNARSHLSALKTIGCSNSCCRFAGATFTGGITGIYPLANRTMQQESKHYISGSSVSGEFVIIYPPVIKGVEHKVGWYIAAGPVYEKDMVTIYQRGII